MMSPGKTARLVLMLGIVACVTAKETYQYPHTPKETETATTKLSEYQFTPADYNVDSDDFQKFLLATQRNVAPGRRKRLVRRQGNPTGKPINAPENLGPIATAAEPDLPEASASTEDAPVKTVTTEKIATSSKATVADSPAYSETRRHPIREAKSVCTTVLYKIKTNTVTVTVTEPSAKGHQGRS